MRKRAKKIHTRVLGLFLPPRYNFPRNSKQYSQKKKCLNPSVQRGGNRGGSYPSLLRHHHAVQINIETMIMPNNMCAQAMRPYGYSSLTTVRPQRGALPVATPLNCGRLARLQNPPEGAVNMYMGRHHRRQYTPRYQLQTRVVKSSEQGGLPPS